VTKDGVQTGNWIYHLQVVTTNNYCIIADLPVTVSDQSEATVIDLSEAVIAGSSPALGMDV
jgi:hypothetical protein